MGFLDKLFGRDPEKVKIQARKKQLSALKESLRTEEIKLNLILRNYEDLKRLEEEMINQGKDELTEVTRKTIAYKIKELREKQKSLDSKIDISDRRTKVLREQVNSLETLVEAGERGLPNEEEIEKISLEASEKLEKLNYLLEKIEGTKQEKAASTDQEIGNIMKEFDIRADKEIKRLEAVERDEKSAEQSKSDESKEEQEPA